MEDGMSISFICPCGNRIEDTDSSQGAEILCQKCGRLVSMSVEIRPRPPQPLDSTPQIQAAVGGCAIWGRIVSVLLLLAAGGCVLLVYYDAKVGADRVSETIRHIRMGVDAIHALVFLALSVKLSAFASCARKFVTTRDGEDLEMAMAAQIVFWRIAAVYGLVLAVLLVVGLRL
jgi:hypothetical protein